MVRERREIGERTECDGTSVGAEARVVHGEREEREWREDGG